MLHLSEIELRYSNIQPVGRTLYQLSYAGCTHLNNSPTNKMLVTFNTLNARD